MPTPTPQAKVTAKRKYGIGLLLLGATRLQSQRAAKCFLDCFGPLVRAKCEPRTPYLGKSASVSKPLARCALRLSCTGAVVASSYFICVLLDRVADPANSLDERSKGFPLQRMVATLAVNCAR
jgi:hypothetical protein